MYLKIKDIQFLPNKKALALLPDGKLLINTINAHSYNVAQHDSEFAVALTKGDVLLPDGAGIVKAVSWLRGEKIERIAGWDLFEWEMMRLKSNHTLSAIKKKIFFLGSSEEVLAKIKEKAAVDFPSLEIYTFSPPFKSNFTELENQSMIDAVNAVQPDLLWIGMTAPKQEKWAYKHFSKLIVNGHVGTIGAVFDFYADEVERAPIWWQKNSLEWLFRLLKEPRRMWRRYLIGNAKFLWTIGKERILN